MRTVRGTSIGWEKLRAKKPVAKKPREKLKCYDIRDDNLAEIGFSSYPEYLNSDLWKMVRQEQLGQFPQCRLCRREATVVHHVMYDIYTLAGRGNLNLVSMCHWCHEWCEFEKGEKLDIYRANEKAMSLLSQPTLKSLLSESAYIEPCMSPLPTPPKPRRRIRKAAERQASLRTLKVMKRI